MICDERIGASEVKATSKPFRMLCIVHAKYACTVFISIRGRIDLAVRNVFQIIFFFLL